MTLEEIIIEIKNDSENKAFTEMGWEPIFMINHHARILIIGPAPGRITQEKVGVFLDRSGDRLREWLQVSDEIFYESDYFAVMPLDFYFPGKGKSGDKPPRKGFANKWHPKLMKLMPNVQLIILVGAFAQKEYLKEAYEKNLTETVRNYKQYLPEYFPIVHPSPLNQWWERINPFFKEDILPSLQKIVADILNDD